MNCKNNVFSREISDKHEPSRPRPRHVQSQKEQLPMTSSSRASLELKSEKRRGDHGFVRVLMRAETTVQPSGLVASKEGL